METQQNEFLCGRRLVKNTPKENGAALYTQSTEKETKSGFRH